MPRARLTATSRARDPLSMNEHEQTGITPAEVARRMAAAGVIVNPATVWSYLRARYAERYPEGVAALPPALLPADEDEIAEWLDDFLDGVEAERTRLVRAMNPDVDASEGDSPAG